jgi:hypothetical protein
MAIKTRYFRITTIGAYCGEVNDYHAAIVMDSNEEPEENQDFCRLLDDCTYENANEWHDEEDHDMTFDEYIEESHVSWEEISYKEYADETPEFVVKHEQEDF